MNEPEIKLSCVSNVYTRQMTFTKSGDAECGHSHPFDHVTMLVRGAVRLTVQGVATEYSAKDGVQQIFIAKDLVHRLEALEDGTVALCVHALRIGEAVEDILDPAMVPAGVDVQSFCKPLIND